MNIIDTIKKVFSSIVNFIRGVFSVNQQEEQDPLIPKLESKGYTYDLSLIHI